MAIYAATLPGRTNRVLVRADNKSEAMGRFVSVESLSADEMQDALDKGEAVWRPDTDLPADQPDTDTAEAEEVPADGAVTE